MADVFVDENTLRGIANAIRSKNGSSATYFPAEMEQAIRDLQIPDVSALNATAADILAPKVAFTADGETEGTIQTKSASDVTVSGDTVSAPAGYYPSAVSKSVQSGSATTPATIIPANPTISVNTSTGLVTASVNETQAITPTVSEGYVSAGTSGNVRASGSATSQLPTQSAATITPTRSQQTAVAAGKFTTGAVVVDPIPSEYIVPTGTKQISITQNGTTTEDVSAYANAQITTNVPNTYAASDEGKVVSNGALVAQGSDTVTQNGTVDTTLINSLTVNVSGGSVDWDGYAAKTWPSGNAVLSVSAIAALAFYADAGVTGIDGPEVLTIGNSAVRSCENLTSVNFPKLTRVGPASTSSTNTYCLATNKAVRTIHLPELVSAWGNYNLSELGTSSARVTIVVPKLAHCGSHTFRGCQAEAIDIGPDLTALVGYMFYNGSYNTVILRYTGGVVTSPDTNAIKSLNANSKVYVPAALVSQYETASNWSTKGSIFYAIEGSIYETKYADGTPIQTT